MSLDYRRWQHLFSRLPKDKWTLGDHLFMARRRERLYPQTVAGMMGWSLSTLSKYERAGDPGGVYPPARKLARLCDYLKVNPTDAFAGIRNDRSAEGK